ncbi:SHOCT domain-containing protein [Microbacterium azadirachtae]|uniref:Short C-terminal domain-containing protein n=1 Tax=Microbacterium azadirachtae TaxID=582680 RepID=A0A1I6G8G1_9MICO|nr:SHOCT domain-containing protein [Microbacterium azadirachtae]SDL37333.1 Short C-terminal domain-containing protein [Microbacterium azadirachtae]SEF68192.1 Short C-terminal domain-containing protein [Microbacterium azadirachtae]SEF68885.1 Short C-terminal domain-containing protein [Microbacterium azadirachtae]SFR38401.1 Short C-terminal domain-containing protein [Microbacterium azadirachtae]
MPFIPRIGRPGLLGLAARTAVVAGTATAVSGGIMAHQQKKARTQYEAAQHENARYEAERPSAGVPVPPTAASDDLVAELQRLGDLRTQGLLSEAEFETAKARLLR